MPVNLPTPLKVPIRTVSCARSSPGVLRSRGRSRKPGLAWEAVTSALLFGSQSGFSSALYLSLLTTSNQYQCNRQSLVVQAGIGGSGLSGIPQERLRLSPSAPARAPSEDVRSKGLCSKTTCLPQASRSPLDRYTLTQVQWLLVRGPAGLTPPEREDVTWLWDQHQTLATLYALVQAFRRLEKDRRGSELEAWAQACEASGIRELKRFVKHLRSAWGQARAGGSILPHTTKINAL